MARVSVVIPCYAQAHFLADAIESALNQTHPEREIIVVDDGSPDDVAAVVERYSEVRLLRQENLGVSRARNRGLEASHGEFVLFLDADDRLLPHALEAGARALTARPECGLVWGHRRLIDVHGNPMPDALARFEGSARYDMLLRGNVIGPPVSVMFRRTVLEGLGGFSPQQKGTADYELYLRVARNHGCWGYPQTVAEYRVHDRNMSHDQEAMLQDSLRTLGQQERWIGEDPALRRALAEGKRNAWTGLDGGLRMQRLSELTRARRWGRVTLSVAALLYRYPRMFLPVLVGRLMRGFRSSKGKPLTVPVSAAPADQPPPPSRIPETE